MISFINKKLSITSKIRLYRFLYTLNAMSFSYLRPVTLASLLSGILYVRFSLPESFLLTVTDACVFLYYSVIVLLGGAFLYYMKPYIRHWILRFRIWLYRRKKRACTTFFF